MRVGRATDLAPLAIPSIVLRKKRRVEGEPAGPGGVETQPYIPGISRPEAGSDGNMVTTAEEGTEEDEYHVDDMASQDPVSTAHGMTIRCLWC
jgi:hypothetical protein